jgi:hypothetical protein
MVLYRVAWASTWTGRVNHHKPEEEADAHAHLAFLRSRHYFTDYWLERVGETLASDATAADEGTAPGELVSEQPGLEQVQAAVIARPGRVS